MYKIDPFEQILNKISKSEILSKNAIIILEYSQKLMIKVPSFLSCFNERKYGKTKINFLVNNN